MTSRPAPRLARAAPLVYWMLVLGGLLAMHHVLEHTDASRAVALWVGAVAGTAMGQISAWKRLPFWFVALLLPVLTIAGVWLTGGDERGSRFVPRVRPVQGLRARAPGVRPGGAVRVGVAERAGRARGVLVPVVAVGGRDPRRRGRGRRSPGRAADCSSSSSRCCSSGSSTRGRGGGLRCGSRTRTRASRRCGRPRSFGVPRRARWPRRRGSRRRPPRRWR